MPLEKDGRQWRQGDEGHCDEVSGSWGVHCVRVHPQPYLGTSRCLECT